jgi:hypothetical protein
MAMALTVVKIRAAKSDDDLLSLLMGELNRMFPQESRRDPVVFLSNLQSAPPGLHAMAATFDLDFSMSLDDLAWHFTNHYDLDWSDETLRGLRELGAVEAAELFAQAFSIVQPLWDQLGVIISEDPKGLHKWLDENGIQERINPLNDRMWKLLNQWPEHGLMHYWIQYARKYPDRCV